MNQTYLDEPMDGVDKAYVYREGEFLGCVVPTHRDYQHATNWRQAALAAARRVWGEGTYSVTSAPYESC
jgi:hypothetical protein